MRLTRRKFLAGALGLPLAGAAAGGGYMRFCEPHWIEVTVKRVPVRNLDGPVRLVHLSDFHASDVVGLDYIASAVDDALRQEPDLICLTGDYITWDLPERARYTRILAKLSAAAPTFACIGNHDGGRWAGSSHGYSDFKAVQGMLEDAGIRFLFNATTTVGIGGQSLRVAGLGDLWSDDTKPDGVLPRDTPAGEPTLLLCHNPDAKAKLRAYGWDLMLSGHTHGGQLVVPILGLRPFLPVRDTSFPEGLLDWGDRTIHITRGIGNLHGLRFNCRPEISLLELEPAIGSADEGSRG